MLSLTQALDMYGNLNGNFSWIIFHHFVMALTFYDQGKAVFMAVFVGQKKIEGFTQLGSQ